MPKVGLQVEVLSNLEESQVFRANCLRMQVDLSSLTGRLPCDWTRNISPCRDSGHMKVLQQVQQLEINDAPTADKKEIMPNI